MAVQLTLHCPGFVFTRRGTRVSVQTPGDLGVVHRRQLDDDELRSWVLRWDLVPWHVYDELLRIYEESEHGILPFSYQPPELTAAIEVSMLNSPEVEFVGPGRISFSVELVEIR